MLKSRKPSLQRSVGKFYSTHAGENHERASSKGQSRGSKGQIQSTAIGSRSKSVGRIYSRGQSLTKQRHISNGRELAQPLQIETAKKSSLSNVNNYQQMEDTISSYLEATMRVSTRQKYNYLSSNPSAQYQSHHLKAYVHQLPQAQPLRDLAQLTRVRDLTQLARDPQLAREQQQISRQQNYNQQHGCSKNEEKSLKNSGGKYPKERMEIHNGANKQNMYFVGSSTKKDSGLALVSLNHEQNKNELESKLKKIISSYESKNKQLSMELQKIQCKHSGQGQEKPACKPSTPCTKAQKLKQVQEPQQRSPYRPQQLSQILEQLKQFNLKGANLRKQVDQKLQEIWKSIHQQIISDESLRIIKCFINQSNITQVCSFINQNRLKKIDVSCLKAHQEEYDPFLVQKFNQLMKNSSPNLCHKQICKWIGENFAKIYDLSEKNYLKNLNTQKFQCSIRALSVEREVGGLRRIQGSKRDLEIRDFTRSLSILFRANLRNRNVYLVFNKLKGMAYIGRFIELLDEKAGNSKTSSK